MYSIYIAAKNTNMSFSAKKLYESAWNASSFKSHAKYSNLICIYSNDVVGMANKPELKKQKKNT